MKISRRWTQILRRLLGLGSSGRRALAEDARRHLADVRGGFDDGGAGGAQRILLGLCSTCFADDDRAGVAHPPPGRSAGPAYEGDDGLAHLSGDVLGSLLLGDAADLADQNDRVGTLIFVE